MHFGFVLAAYVIYNKNPIYFPRIGTTYAYYIGICIPHNTYYIYICIILYYIPTRNGQRGRMSRVDYEQINLRVSKCTLICVQTYILLLYVYNVRNDAQFDSEKSQSDKSGIDVHIINDDCYIKCLQYMIRVLYAINV